MNILEAIGLVALIIVAGNVLFIGYLAISFIRSEVREVTFEPVTMADPAFDFQ